jgi:hypothetical protein
MVERILYSLFSHVCRTIAAGALVSIFKALAKQSVVVCVHTPSPQTIQFSSSFFTSKQLQESQIKTDLVVPSMH